MTIMVIGGSGQLGSELLKILPDSVGVFHNPSENNFCADFMKEGQIGSIIKEAKPDLVINCTAFTDVDGCERDREKAYRINGNAVLEIVNSSKLIGAKVIHVSTDYVYNGETGNYTETDVPSPINYYGLSKLVGDCFVLSYEQSIVIRTSGVFGIKNNFPGFVLNNLRNGKPVRVIDSIYSPIHATMLARAIRELASTDTTGIVNVAGDKISRSKLAEKIANLFSLDSSLITEVPESEMTWIAKRPYDSSLDITKASGIITFDFHSTEKNIALMA